MSKKFLIAIALFCVLFAGCSKVEVSKTYEQSESDGIVTTYSKLSNGTWQCNDTTYQYRLELCGRMPNATVDSYYVVLTDDADLTFETVSSALYSSWYDQSQHTADYVIVELK